MTALGGIESNGQKGSRDVSPCETHGSFGEPFKDALANLFEGSGEDQACGLRWFRICR